MLLILQTTWNVEQEASQHCRNRKKKLLFQEEGSFFLCLLAAKFLFTPNRTKRLQKQVAVAQHLFDLIGGTAIIQQQENVILCHTVAIAHLQQQFFLLRVILFLQLVVPVVPLAEPETLLYLKGRAGQKTIAVNLQNRSFFYVQHFKRILVETRLLQRPFQNAFG